MTTVNEALALTATALRIGVEMREAQAEYFRTKSKKALIDSKDQERAFDMAAARALHVVEPFIVKGQA